MIQDRLFDVAMVCSPPFLHEPQLEALITANIPCLVEKPAALTPAGVNRIASLAMHNNVLVGVAHHLRYSAMYEKVLDLLCHGDLGQIHHAYMEWSFHLDKHSKNARWKLNPALNGASALSDAGIHCIDVAVSLFGAGEAASVTSEMGHGGTVEDLTIETKHGNTRVTVTCSRRYGPYSNLLKISGTQGELFVPGFFSEDPALKAILFRGNRQFSIVVENRRSVYALEVEDFVSAVGRGEPCRGCSLPDALLAAYIVEAVEKRLVDSFQEQRAAHPGSGGS